MTTGQDPKRSKALTDLLTRNIIDSMDIGDGLKAVSKIITPDVARQLLALNNGNRCSVKDRVDQLSQMMTDGKFLVNGDTIRISAADNVVDGAHRLKACLKSNVSFRGVIITGLSIEAVATIDQGLQRNVANILGIVHDLAPKNSSIVSATAAALLAARDGKAGHDRPAIAAYVAQECELIEEWATWGKTISRTAPKVLRQGSMQPTSVLAPALLATLGIIMVDAGADKGQVREFYKRIESGNTSDSDISGAINALRNHLRQSQLVRLGGKGRVSLMLFEFATHITAFNKWIANEGVTRIRPAKGATFKTVNDLPVIWGSGGVSHE
jgi:hypothetical protein